MENSNKQTIDRLYLTRALLSNISQNDDDFQNLEKSYNELKKRDIQNEVKKEIKEEIENDKDIATMREYEKNLECKIEAMDKEECVTNEKITRLKKEVDSAFSSKTTAVLTAITIVLICFVSGFFLIRWWINTGYSFLVGLLVVPLSLILLLFLLYGLSLIVTAGQETKAYKESFLAEANKEKEKIQNNKNALEKERDNIRNSMQIRIDSLSLKYKLKTTELDETKKSYLRDIEEKQLSITKKSTKLNNCLKNNAVIDERDWKNLDLIIYELETGRADTIKEALQQADLYIRHDEIIEAMETATSAICSSIRENIGALSNSIGFALSELRFDLEDINQSNRELSNKFDTLIDAQELSNALLEKANVSSKQLAEDVGRIRQLEDFEFYGIK